MRFCPIMPISAFPHFGKRSTWHMALIQFLHHPKYLKFYQEKVEAGEIVMLDNGAYEGVQVPPNELDYWAWKLKPTVLILPDAPWNAHETLRRSLNYLHDYKIPNDAMMVLHAKDGHIKEFIAAYKLCPVNWIGLSRLTGRYNSENYGSNRRIVFVRELIERGLWRPELEHHLLGMLDGDIQELQTIKDHETATYMKQIFRSIDSSAPIWRGMHGYTMDMKWPNYAFDAEASDEADCWITASNNLDQVMEACGAD